MCGKRGHFMCSQMRWFFGLNGITCFNCGGTDHHGSQCNRPRVEDCARNSELVQDELDLAGKESLAQELEFERTRRDHHSYRRGVKERYDNNNDGNNRDRNMKRNNNRSKSQPPQQTRFLTKGQTSTYGKIIGKNNYEQRNSITKRGKERRKSTGELNGKSKNKRGYYT